MTSRQGVIQPKLRLAVIRDLREENWPSMDLVAEMLFQQLQANHADQIAARQVCPPFRRRFTLVTGGAKKSVFFNADRMLNRYWDYPRWLQQRAQEFDLFHVVDHSYSQLVHELPPGRTVVTCHDLDTFRCLLEPEEEPRPVWFRLMTRRILNGFRQAARVICDSPSTYEQVLRFGLIVPERVRMIPLGVHPSCSPNPNQKADDEAANLVGTTDSSPLLLHVGSTIARKRIDVLLEVFAAVKHFYPSTRLIRVGGPLTPIQAAQVETLKLKDSIISLPFLERDVLAAIYRRATLVLQPSEREGFGLPVVEAMACGTPVVASDLSVLRQVGGETAIYCPVGEVVTWSQQVTHLLDEREAQPGKWARRRELSLQQAAKFSWLEYARQVVGIYQEILSPVLRVYA